MIIEMREAAYEKAFGLLDELKELGKQKKMVMCELEDALYECYESSKQNDEYSGDEYDDEDRDTELNLRSSRGMRRNMRMRHDDEHDEEMDMRAYRRSSGMRRRNRMGRFI